MKNIQFKKIILATAALAVLLIWSCTKEKTYSDGFDINYPLPTISDFSPKEQFIDSIITITGQNLDKTTSVTVGLNNSTGKILSKTATEVKVKLSRNITGAGLVNLGTSYKNQTVSKDIFKPKYPDTKITRWPDKIIRGQTLLIKADNGDQIIEVEFVGIGKKVTDFKNGTTDAMNVFTEGLTLPDKVKLVVKAYGNVINGSSPDIPVENYDPNASFTPEEPVVLWDFEDGVNPVTGGQGASKSGINLNTTIIKGRGDKFLTVKNDAVTNRWSETQGIISKENIKLTGFHDPHLTFMVNSAASYAYFQVAVKQGAVESIFHFKAGNTDVSTDDFHFKTDSKWQWRSVSLTKVGYESTGSGILAFDVSKPIDKITLQFVQGAGGRFGVSYETNLDQVMITDGPRSRDANNISVWDFEDGANPASGAATTGINLNNVGLGQGNRFLTVKAASITADWTWIASAEKAMTIDMSTWKQPYVSFWVNTGANKCYGQIAFKQGTSEFGFEISPDYNPQATVGKWKFYKIKLEKTAASRWSGTADFNPKGTITNVKIGFTTGKIGVGTPYEFNIDEINVSDRPAW